MIGACVQGLISLALLASGPAPTKHILFAFVDHFEPYGALASRQVDAWVDDYMAMARRHVDADGRHPVHSYFLISPPAIDPGLLETTLVKLNEATYRGYGEVEYHCHHGVPDERVRTEQEATEDLVRLVADAKARFTRHGALITAESRPQVTFGFIHGMWALDNSRRDPWYRGDGHQEYCGVDRELELLSRLGAYADFTFPAWGPMEPFLKNAIFYAADDDHPASYESLAQDRLVEVGQPAWGDLMLIEGPAVDYSWGADATDNIGCVTNSYHDWPSLKRMAYWVGCNIHVIGNDDWIFVKVHTHGCAGNITDTETWDCFFGGVMDSFYSQIEGAYNEGTAWKLHYVSAREMYNLVKAAEAGMTGNPDLYRDFLIKPPANSVILAANPYRLISDDAKGIAFEIIGDPAQVDMTFSQYSVYHCLCLESSDPEGPWEAADAQELPGESGEMHVIDATPSRFYRVIPLGSF
jgi:hypothetical protein